MILDQHIDILAKWQLNHSSAEAGMVLGSDSDTFSQMQVWVDYSLKGGGIVSGAKHNLW